MAATSGNDTINGTAGNDIIDGLAGDDVITGALGADTIRGGAGRDRFIIRGAADMVAGESYAGGDGYDTLVFGGRRPRHQPADDRRGRRGPERPDDRFLGQLVRPDDRGPAQRVR
jgi:hypothetical protein